MKIVLQINGFNSFLALKGIRYDDKKEFFQSLETTVKDYCDSDDVSSEKSDLLDELASQRQTIKNFKLRPGDRNCIMNLMLEIEKTEASDFFGRSSELFVQDQMTSPHKQNFALFHEQSPQKLIARRSDEKNFFVAQPDHGYSRDDDQQEQEYVLEEEYLTDDTMDSMGLIKIEYEDSPVNAPAKRKSTSSATHSAKRRPDRMYNEEFMAKCVNPRRRRIALNKTYPATDEGTRERFADLIQQVRNI